jgi:hypothetical protein
MGMFSVHDSHYAEVDFNRKDASGDELKKDAES